MEILRVPPYSDTTINFTIPTGYSVATDFKMYLYDMADLSFSHNEFLNKVSGQVISTTLNGRYDSNYELTVLNENEEVIHSEFYEVVRPYSNPEDNGTTASEIAEYALKEEIARAVIDSIVPEGFYYKRKVLNFTGNGSDYLPIWDDVKKVLSVYENNKLVEDRTYEVTSDKTAIVESSAENINRAESAPLILPAASSDSLNPLFVYRGFAHTWDYKIEVECGYISVPSDIRRAAEMLIHDIDCGKLDYYKRYISSYNTDQFKIQFDKSVFEGTGNIIVDKILSKYAKSIKKIGVL